MPENCRVYSIYPIFNFKQEKNFIFRNCEGIFWVDTAKKSM